MLEMHIGRITDTPIHQLFSNLQCSGKTHVCLFPTREQCDIVIEQILQGLNTEIQQIACSDEIDENKSTRTWGRAAGKAKKRLQQHCRFAGIAQSDC